MYISEIVIQEITLKKIFNATLWYSTTINRNENFIKFELEIFFLNCYINVLNFFLKKGEKKKDLEKKPL